MATKIKMLKLLQEMQGLTQAACRRPAPRHPGLLAVQIRMELRDRASHLKRVLPVVDHEPLDIPHPVKIRHLQSESRSRPLSPTV
jgi:hypothetical protein